MKTKIFLLAIVPILFLISLFPFLTSKQNVVIVSVNNNLCENVKVGGKISEVNGYIINSVKDFENALKGVKKGDYVTLVVNGGPGGCKAIEDADIGIKVKEEKGRKIVFGPEISGARVFFLTSENKTELAKILEKRIKYLALPYTYAEIKGNYVVLTSLPEVDLTDILFIGHFEGFVRQTLELENNSAKLRIGDKVHNIEIKNNKTYVDGKLVKNNFEINGIKVKIKETSNTTITVEEVFLTNKDVKRVYTSYARIKYNSNIGKYEVTLPILISNSSSEKFSNIIKGLKTRYVNGLLIMEGNLVYSLDENEIGELILPFELYSKKIKIINIFATADSYEEIENIRNKLVLATSYGELPNFEIEKETYQKPSNPNILYYFSIGMGIEVVLLALTFILVRERNFVLITLLLPLITWSIILFSQQIYPFSWVIDTWTLIGLSIGFFLPFFEFTLKRKNFKVWKFEISVLLLSIPIIFFYKGLGLSLLTCAVFLPLLRYLLNVLKL